MKLHPFAYVFLVASCMVMSVNASQPNSNDQQPNGNQRPGRPAAVGSERNNVINVVHIAQPHVVVVIPNAGDYTVGVVGVLMLALQGAQCANDLKYAHNDRKQQ
jgi:hypothetical protein